MKPRSARFKTRVEIRKQTDKIEQLRRINQKDLWSVADLKYLDESTILQRVRINSLKP